MPATPADPDSLRAAEVAASMCLATDLAMGFPLEHGFSATLMARRLCELIGADDETAHRVYFASLLMYSGCTSESALGAQVLKGARAETLVPHLFGSYPERIAGMIRSVPSPDAAGFERAFDIARGLPRLIMDSREQQAALCEVAEMLATRLDLPDETSGLFTFLTERWDGKSVLRRAERDEIPLEIRVVILTRDLAFQREIGGIEHALQIGRERAGNAFDPGLTEVFVANAEDIFSVPDAGGSMWEAVLAAEPRPWHMLHGAAIDRALSAVGDFADLISPSLSGHSAALSRLVDKAARLAGFEGTQVRDVRRAAQVHDVGRVAIDARIWEKTTPLSRDEYEKVRLHPYHTERVLNQSDFLRPLSEIARDHHERLDGSGYHRGVEAPSLSLPARLLAAADAFEAMTEGRAHRAAREPHQASSQVARMADQGLLDHGMVEAVIEAAGQPVPDMERPGRLTDREAQVIGLAARGLQTKQIATALGISPKTADTHMQSAYRKMGVSTRAAATLYAMDHGIVASGELPIPP